MNKTICMTVSCLILCVFAAGAQQPSTSPQVEVPLLPKSRATSPSAPAEAVKKTQKNSIGGGRATVNASGPSDSWEEHNAMGGVYKATVVTEYLYDAKAGILYAYRHGDFACSNQNMSGNALEALYAEGNQAGQPAGSGWYVAELNAGQCGARVAGIYGCRFNADGQRTECGLATINNQTGQVDFAEISQ